MRFRVSAILVLLTLTVLAARAQQPTSQVDTPVFRTSVDAIEIDAFVVDAQGNPVTTLTIEDFEILEDGKPQAITSFALVDIPIEKIESVEAAAVASDVRTNQQPEGRIYLFAVDEIPGSSVPRLRYRLRQFVEQHFGPNDSAAIVYWRPQSTTGR